MGGNAAKSEAKEENQEKGKEKPKKKRRKFMEQYCTNLTEKAREGKIDVIIGRDKELYKHCEGIISNVMEFAECSKIPLMTIGDFLWNPIAYNPENSLKNAHEEMLGDDADSFFYFADHLGVSCLTRYSSSYMGQVLSKVSFLESTDNKEEALKLFELPRAVGQHEGIDIICTKGRFGPYIKYGDRNISLPKGADPLKVDLETCVKLISESAEKKTGAIIAEYKESDIQIIDGAYGPYIKHAGSNYRIPKGTAPEELTEEKCREIISSSEPTGRKKRRK